MADTNDISARDSNYGISQNDIVSLVAREISSTLGSPLSQMAKVMDDMNKTLTKIEKGTVGTSKGISSGRSSRFDMDFSREFSSSAKSLDEISKYLKRERIQARRDRQDFSSRVSDAKTTGIDLVFNKKLEELYKGLEKRIDRIQSGGAEDVNETIISIRDKFYELKTSIEQDLEDYKKSMPNSIDELRNELKAQNDSLQRERSKAGGGNIDYIQEYEQNIRELSGMIDEYEQNVSTARSKLKNLAKDEIAEIENAKLQAVEASRKATEKVAEELKMRYADTFDAVKDALSGTEQLASNSAYIAETLEEREKTKSEQIQDEINKQLEITQAAIKSLQKLLDEDKSLTEAQRADIEKQIEVLNANKKAYEKWNPVRDEMSKAAKSLKSAGESIVKGLLGTAFKRLEDYYLDSYKEGFNKVYDSVESTRNTVSARLRLDQGGFSEMQEEIQAEIEAQGLESSITQADVNDALVSLSAAGVTDKDMLKALALEQAKLAASGSSLNIGNEEALNNIRQMYQAQIQNGADQQTAIKGIMTLLDRVAAQQREIGTSGWDSSLVNGQMDQIFNQMAEIGIAGKKSMDEMAKDITAAMQYSEHYYGMGLDPNELYQYIKDISQGTVASNSTFEKVLQVQGIDRNAILEKGIDELYSEISTVLQDVASTGDTKYRAEVLQAFGLSMTPLDAEKLANGVATIQTTSLEQLDATTKQTQIDMQNGTYLSKTQTHQNEAANAMAEIAIGAEKQYKGNEYVLAGFDAVTNGLNAIENVAEEILMSMLTGSGKNFADGDFMTGRSGTAAGTFGKAAGAAVGVGLTGYAIYDAVSENASNGALEVATSMTEDPKFWAGVGTTVGSVVGGPAAGAVVGGAMGAATVLGEKITSTKLGNEIVSGISDALTFGLIHDTEEDPTFVAARELSESTNEQFLAAQEQINAAQEMLETYNKMSDGEKKLELLKKKVIDDDGKVIDASRLATMETEELNKLFEDNLVKEQENIITQQQQLKAEQEAILAKSSQIAEANLLMEESGTGNIADDRARFEGALGGKQISDIYSSLDMSGMDDSSLIQYIISSGYSGSIQNLKNKSSDELIKMAQQSKLASFSSQAGFSEYTSDVMNESFKMWQNRKEKYEEADAKFAEKLSNYAETDGKEYADDPFNLAMNYAIEYIKEEKDQNTFMNAVEKSLSETGSIHLDDNGGYYLKDYKEGVHFASGLTNVPYDNYPALLHEGERILTAKEAQAYNEMSSFAVSNLSNAYNSNYDTSSNVFATTGYGTGIETSIKDQTSSVLQKLDQVIDAIKALSISISTGGSAMSAAHRNVIRGNSNITQLNTL